MVVQTLEQLEDKLHRVRSQLEEVQMLAAAELHRRASEAEAKLTAVMQQVRACPGLGLSALCGSGRSWWIKQGRMPSRLMRWRMLHWTR